MGRTLGRHRSTIGRELARNRSTWDRYEWYHAECVARAHRSRSRRNQRQTPRHSAIIRHHLEQRWSPEQIAQVRGLAGRRWISHESMYRHLRDDTAAGGARYRWLPQGREQRRRHFHPRVRGGPRGRSRAERPAAVDARREVGPCEIETVMGPGPACLVIAVERATGYVVIGKLDACTAAAPAARAIHLLRDQPHPVRTITADNGSEMTGYRRLEGALGTTCYFTQPYSAWQHGSIENVNGLIRRYYPKGTAFTPVTQYDCNRIPRQLNHRPRKRLNWRSPEACYVG